MLSSRCLVSFFVLHISGGSPLHVKLAPNSHTLLRERASNPIVQFWRLQLLGSCTCMYSCICTEAEFKDIPPCECHTCT